MNSSYLCLDYYNIKKAHILSHFLAEKILIDVSLQQLQNFNVHMTAQERYFARILFRNKVLELKGMEFQRFFVEIMSSANPNFRNPKPHGKEGDWKCDGYDLLTGQFYQVYAPEKPSDPKIITKAVKKLEESFEGLLAQWGTFTSVKAFFFVYNDHFWGGVYPEIEKRLVDLSSKYGIPCALFLSKELQLIFEQLDFNAKANCLQCVIPETLNNNIVVSFKALNEVIEHILALPYQLPSKTRKLVLNPEFFKKIEFNTLSTEVAELLKRGAYQVGALNHYFESESELKIILQQKFSALYEEGRQIIINDALENSDELFFYIFEKACPDGVKKYFGEAVEVLMAYYFECCDIFEPPKTTLFD